MSAHRVGAVAHAAGACKIVLPHLHLCPAFTVDAARPVLPRCPAVATLDRRSTLLAGLGALVLSPSPAAAAANEAVTAGLSKYIRQKKLDRVDSYAAPLLEAQDQLVRIGRIMREYPSEIQPLRLPYGPPCVPCLWMGISKPWHGRVVQNHLAPAAVVDPAGARKQLRSGAFAGLRSSVRGVAEYAGRARGAEAGVALGAGFLNALEGLDVELLRASRSQEPLGEGIRPKFEACGTALAALLGAVPEEELESARRVLQVARSPSAETYDADPHQPEVDKLKQLL